MLQSTLGRVALHTDPLVVPQEARAIPSPEKLKVTCLVWPGSMDTDPVEQERETELPRTVMLADLEVISFPLLS